MSGGAVVKKRFTVEPVDVYRVVDECEDRQWAVFDNDRCLVFFDDEEYAQRVADDLNRGEAARSEVRLLL